MSVPRFHCDVPLPRDGVGSIVALPESAAHHALRVLRLAPGDALRLFDGTGGEHDAVLVEAPKGKARARLEAFRPEDRESPLALTLVQAIPASEAMDYAVRKAVELGVTAIVPLLCARSAPLPAGERRMKRREHWTSIAIAACEQCGRNRVPAIAEPMDFEAWSASATTPVIACLPSAGRSWAELPACFAQPPREVAVLIGPEGGFAPDELAHLEARGCTRLRLGPRVLRAETATVAALTLLQALWGDLR